MKRFKSIAGLAVGLLLAGSMLAAPALAQPPTESNGPGGGYNNNTTDVSVTITETGTFDAYFCQVLDEHSPSSSLALNPAPTLSSAGLATGTLTICYTDTLAQRPEFNTQITASQFMSETLQTIPMSGFHIDRVQNVQQHYWGDSPTNYGDIGVFVNNAYPAGGQPQNFDWAAWSTNNVLGIEPLTVQFGYHGIGTDWSYGRLDISLVLPIGTQGGTYTSTLNLDIVTGTQP